MIDFEVVGDLAYAVVEGSDDYQVDVGLTERAEEDNDCTCPYFEDHGVCKHLVAVLCEAHARGVLEPVGVGDAAQRVRQDLSVMFGDTLLTLQAPKHSAADKPVAQPRWRQRLAAIASAQTRARGRELLPPRAELMYILDPAQSGDTSCLSVEVAYRVPLSDGRWSVVKRRDFSRYDLPLLPTAEDRHALALLMGSPTELFGYDYFSTRNRPFSVPDAAHPGLFALIGPTGRCHLRRDGKKDDLVALRWDGDEPWEARVQVEPTGPGEDYRLAMVLRRGGEVLSIHEPEVLTGGGILVRGDVLSRVSLDRPGVASWIEAERSSGAARLRSRAGRDELIVPRAEAGPMLEQLLSMPGVPALSLPDELAFQTVPGTPRPRLRITSPDAGSWEERLRAEMSVGYGRSWLGGPDDRAGVFDAEARRFIERDASAEQAWVNQLLGAGLTAPGQHDREHAWHFVLQPKQLSAVAAALVDAGWLVEADGKPYRGGASITLSVQSGIDWFELHGEVRFGEQTAALPELLQALQAGRRTVVLDDGTHGLLPEDWLKRYGLLGDFGQVEGGHMRFQPSQAMLLDALLSELPGVDVDAQFKRVRQRIKRAGKAGPKSPPRTFKGELRPYQREGLGWMHQLQRLGLGGCLADDMGLGKTVQVLSLFESRRVAKPADRPEHPSLVVVPKSLVFNWMQETKRFTPRLKLLNHTGKDRFARHGLTRSDLDTPEAAQTLDQAFHAHDLVLTTYGVLRQDMTALKDIHFDYAVLDEAQAIKNANTASAKAARLIRADRRLAVSGTPIENHFGELWSLFAFINPGMLGQGRLGKQLQAGGKQIDAESRQLLGQALRPYILRRTKAQVAADLPDKTEQTLYCELSAKQRKLYNQVRDHYRAQLLGRIETHGLARSKIQVLEALLRLRQAACHPGLVNKQYAKADSAKLDQLLAQLQAVLDEGHKALVFSQFTQMLGLLRDRLGPLGIDYAYLDGKTRKRQDQVDRFQDDPGCKLFLISLKAGGTGLNLTAADYVFLLDPWWNPAVEAQAIDRTHRIGQDKHVFAYRLIAKDTVEEKVLELQQTKRELADAIIGEDNSVLRDLTREDMEALLG